MTTSLFLVFVVAVSLASISPSDDAKDAVKSIQGTWLPQTGELGGKEFSQDILKTIKLVIKDETYTVTAGKEPDRGTLKLDPSAKPKAMDIVGTDGPNKGKTILAIYEVTDDMLRICYDLEGKKRPAEFKTAKDTQQLFIVYKREKP
jgi:uncharacterized protein (TIGR03067 family)